MELPFAVASDSSQDSKVSARGSALHDSATDNDSLVTASSDGSFHLSPHVALDSNTVREDYPAETVTSDALWGRKSAERSRVSSVLSHLNFGVSLGSSSAKRPPNVKYDDDEEAEVIDFTYVNVQETDADEVDILLAGGDPGMMGQPALYGSVEQAPSNLLALFLSGRAEDDELTEKLVDLSEQANEASRRAAQAKHDFKLAEALDAHSTAARLFYEAALLLKDRNSSSMASSFLLLSQTEARSALALKRIIKLRPNTLLTKERLRATVRGALDNRRAEADISDSIFLGTANAPSNPMRSAAVSLLPNDAMSNPSSHENPVDDIMQLERELQNMDMALELGNSIASLDGRSNRLRNSAIDGSFMVVPPGSNSYMSSSMVLGAPSNPRPTSNRATGTTARARPNRVQNIMDASMTRPAKGTLVPASRGSGSGGGGLESSWWGNASQVLSSSVSGDPHSASGAPTKQLMRLMDSLKTLGDENASLLRQVEDAEAARGEAKAAKLEMHRFREVYSKRFEALKAALEKFRKGYPDTANPGSVGNPVAKSEYMQQASTTEQQARQEQLIRKLTADLKKEKEENRKKDAAIRKYESFYREVKARSAQKAAQRRGGTGGTK